MRTRVQEVAQRVWPLPRPEPREDIGGMRRQRRVSVLCVLSHRHPPVPALPHTRHSAF